MVRWFWSFGVLFLVLLLLRRGLILRLRGLRVILVLIDWCGACCLAYEFLLDCLGGGLRCLAVLKLWSAGLRVVGGKPWCCSGILEYACSFAVYVCAWLGVYVINRGRCGCGFGRGYFLGWVTGVNVF